MTSDLIINTNPKSAFSEAIKTIRTNLAFANVGGNKKVILMTSSQPGEGKSFIAANLAVAYAQEGKKVLVIDCDLRKGRQHRIFEIMNSTLTGYSNLIINCGEEEANQGGKDFIKKYIIPTAIKNISIIPTGPTPPNPVELLGSEQNESLLKELKKMFDIIILDCPPVLGLSDTLIMTKYSDINIVVAACKETKTESLQETVKAFNQVNAKIAGVVLNKISLKDNHYYSYYSQDYYGHKENE